jgi:hypothetical protein
MQLSPSTPSGWLLVRVRARLGQVQRGLERGASTVEWMIITAVLVAIAVAVGVIIYNFVISPAEPPQSPPVPGQP